MSPVGSAAGLDRAQKGRTSAYSCRDQIAPIKPAGTARPADLGTAHATRRRRLSRLLHPARRQPIHQLSFHGCLGGTSCCMKCCRRSSSASDEAARGTAACLARVPARLVPMRMTTHEVPSPLCRSPQDHMKISLDLKGFVRGLDLLMPTFRLPAEQQPDVMPVNPSLCSGS
jgi:hypothetical protein